MNPPFPFSPSARAVIWDLDNCLSHDKWRLPLINWKLPRGVRWALYHAYAHLDNSGNLLLFSALHRRERGNPGPMPWPVFVTARPEAHRKETATWIAKHYPWLRSAFFIYMRDDDDDRPSVEIKRDIVRKYILGKWKVVHAFDDRADVVEMYNATEGLMEPDARAHRLWLHDAESHDLAADHKPDATALAEAMATIESYERERPAAFTPAAIAARLQEAAEQAANVNDKTAAEYEATRLPRADHVVNEATVARLRTAVERLQKAASRQSGEHVAWLSERRNAALAPRDEPPAGFHRPFATLQDDIEALAHLQRGRAPVPPDADAGEDDAAAPRGIAEALREAADVAEERALLYGDAYRHGGAVLLAIFGGKIPEVTDATEATRLNLIALALLKLRRLAVTMKDGSHADSATDLAVYAAMMKEFCE